MFGFKLEVVTVVSILDAATHVETTRWLLAKLKSRAGLDFETKVQENASFF